MRTASACAMKCSTGPMGGLLTALQDVRPRRPRPVLIEALRGRVSGHAYIDALQVSVPIAVVEAYEINIPPSRFAA